jgi:beta-glucosidase
MFDEYQKYGLPLMVTENGMADDDDDQRPYYTLQHLYEVANAIRDGYDVRGYFHWTLSDNFEWQYGTNLKEGMYSVDFADPSFPRTPRGTVDLFSKIAHARAIDSSTWSQYALSSYPPGIP